MRKSESVIKKIWPFLLIISVWLVLFRPFWLKGLLPIPADIIAGVYYPWLDYKWGFAVGVPVKNPLISDVPSLLYPWRSLAIDQLKLLRWPLWNPYYFGGMPLLANFQSAVFSYVNVFFLFFSKPIAWSLGVMTSPILTMLAMYALLRHKKLEIFPSLLGAIVFGLSGFEIAWLEYNVHGHTALFLPLLLLIIGLFFEGKKWALFLLPLFVAFQIFAGYIPVVIYTYIVCFFYIVFFHFLPQVKKKFINWQKYLIFFGFWVIGLGISAVQLLPGYELTSLSIRKTDPIVAASNASYLPLKNLITLLAPDFFGNPATGNYFGTAFYDNFYFFVGTGTLIFVLYSLFFVKRKKNIFFWWGMLFFSFVLCFKNPLGLLLEKILFLSGGVAAKALFITDFSLAMLAALGMDALLKDKEKNRKALIVSIAVVIGFMAIALTLSLKIPDLGKRMVAQRNLVIPAGIILSSAVVLVAGKLKSKYLNISCLLFLFLTTTQLLYSAGKYLPFSKQELLFPSTPVIDFLKEKQKEASEPFRVELGEVIPQNFLMPYGIETTSGYDALLPRQTAEFLSLLQNGKIEDRISRVHLLTNYDSPLFPLLNTKYILAKKMDKNGMYSPEGNPPGKFLEKRYQLVYEDKTVQVYEDKSYFPRAFWVHDYSLIASPLNVDLRTKATLASKPPFFPSEKNSEIDLIEWKDYRPDKTTIVAESDQPGLVVFSDSYFPGWQVFLDGKETELYQADLAFRSVYVPEGKHLLTLEYQPKSFLYGGLISFFVLANWILLIGLFLLKKIRELKR